MRPAASYSLLDSPIGELLLLGNDVALHGLYMQAGSKPMSTRPDWQRDDDAFGAARSQLEEYFSGERREFDVPLIMHGSEFERRVWRALQDIPYGETTSYGEIARRIGEPDAARGVGWANGRNPIAVIVPCHRVIGADGKLVGYGGGLDNKRLLLELEAGVMPLV
jgi:methylated-DNA-[protein]-cysteine S-methyltransferase